LLFAEAGTAKDSVTAMAPTTSVDTNTFKFDFISISLMA
jgi:hypothetical protein